jgi:hypothetical protein
MNIMKNKVKTYCFTCIVLTLILTLLRFVSLTTFYDVQTGYFNSAPVPKIMNAIYFLGATWCLSTLILIPRSQIETKFAPNSVYVKGASVAAAIIFMISAVCICTADTAPKLQTLCAVFSAISALFFLSSISDKEVIIKVKAFLSIALIASLTIILATVYFDMTIAMNSPHKIHGSFVLMSAMILALCETRAFLGNPMPRLHLATALLTFMLGVSFALSAVIYLFTVHQPSHFVATPIVLGNLGYIGIITGISVYAISRCFSFDESPADKAEESNGL